MTLDLWTLYLSFHIVALLLPPPGTAIKGSRASKTSCMMHNVIVYMCQHVVCALDSFHLFLDRSSVTRNVLRIGLDRGHPPTPPQTKALGYSWLLS